MKTENEVTINGSIYVLKSSIPIQIKKASPKGKMPYVMIRTYSAGVHIGYLKKRTGKEVELLNTRRIWSWAGAATLSQLASEGSKKSKDCKFSVELESIELTEAIEIIPVTAKAAENFKTITEWKM